MVDTTRANPGSGRSGKKKERNEEKKRKKERKGEGKMRRKRKKEARQGGKSAQAGTCLMEPRSRGVLLVEYSIITLSQKERESV